MESKLKPISFSISQKDFQLTFRAWFLSPEPHRQQKLQIYVPAFSLLPSDEKSDSDIYRFNPCGKHPLHYEQSTKGQKSFSACRKKVFLVCTGMCTKKMLICYVEGVCWLPWYMAWLYVQNVKVILNSYDGIEVTEALAEKSFT